MKLYNDHILALKYMPGQDILTAVLQEKRDFSVSEIRQAAGSIIGCLKEHAISRLLVDFTRNTHDFTLSEYKVILAHLAVGLRHTSINKLARIGTIHNTRERKIAYTCRVIDCAVPIPMYLKTFSNKPEALLWLAIK